MKYTRELFALQLRNQIASGKDCEEIADWAFQIYINHGLDLDDELDRCVLKLLAMQEGPEFILSKEQLESIAAQLSEPDPNGVSKSTKL